MTVLLFELSFALAAPVWLLMILAPKWSWTARVAASPLTVVPILLVYLGLAAPVVPELWAAVREPDLETFRALTALADGAGAIWAQVIAWDLLIGQWVFLESRRLGLHPLVSGPLLVLTILLSPVALLLFLPLRAALAHRTAKGPSGRPGRDLTASVGPDGPGTDAAHPAWWRS
ncbi:ABA4-like family protein [Streptomyces sp. TRM49041]|uniref:ABA4-like family protein n=1 Tax=Streptomyces sp. TRM49041 TaxID=2603216 RepID=UPI0011EFCB24|nr:ABA4-like family protein [Streptomyces sp. TRM49041]